MHIYLFCLVLTIVKFGGIFEWLHVGNVMNGILVADVAPTKTLVLVAFYTKFWCL